MVLLRMALDNLDGRMVSISSNLPSSLVFPQTSFLITRREDVATQGTQDATIPCVFLRKEFVCFFGVCAKLSFRFEDWNFLFRAVD